MMSMFLYLFTMILVSTLRVWGLIPFYLMFGFIYFLFNVWFYNYYVMVAYSFGGDVLSMSMIFLSFWVLCLMILASSKVYSMVEFMFINIVLLMLLVLSFSTTNLFLYYLFFESSLIPTLLLIFGWGYQPERLGAGFYLLFYTLTASFPLLLSVFYVYQVSGSLFYFLIDLNMNFIVYISIIFAFLVKLPMVFVHFWLPSAHVEAPVAGSMILAGVLLKLGGYGLMRVLYFMNEYSVYFNYLWIGLGMFGSVLVGVLCLYQVDMKSMIAYSSVAHMGMVMGGILSLNYWGACGSLIMMIGHGVCSSGLFCLANILYERTGSRSFVVNKGMMLFMPSFSLFWFILISNNMSAPLSLNFLGEVMLINSLMGWSTLSGLFLGVSSFLSCCYSMYLYSYTQHGDCFKGILSFSYGTVREYTLVFYHLFLLNVLIMSSDIFVLWI